MWAQPQWIDCMGCVFLYDFIFAFRWRSLEPKMNKSLACSKNECVPAPVTQKQRTSKSHPIRYYYYFFSLHSDVCFYVISSGAVAWFTQFFSCSPGSLSATHRLFFVLLFLTSFSSDLCLGLSTVCFSSDFWNVFFFYFWLEYSINLFSALVLGSI